jgi:hypothetical protein
MFFLRSTLVLQDVNHRPTAFENISLAGQSKIASKCCLFCLNDLWLALMLIVPKAQVCDATGDATYS